MVLNPAPCCQDAIVHNDILNTVRTQLPPDELLYVLAELFKR